MTNNHSMTEEQEHRDADVPGAWEHRTVASLTAADIGKKIRATDYAGVHYIDVLTGVEFYAMPRRTILHLGDGWTEVFTTPDAPVQVAS